MAGKIKKQFGRITLFIITGLLMSIFIYSCKKKEQETSTNQPPVAKAGSDMSIVFPKDSVILDGSASSDPDGNIGSYSWVKMSGGVCTLMTVPGSPKVIVTKMVAGTYVFKLTVTDMFGATSYDEVIVTVSDLNKTAVATIAEVYMDTTISGTASFTQKNNEPVTLMLDITVPYRANKSVAVHIHAKADCSMNASMAMGHWNPTGASHGQWGVGSFHIGDIGNISLDAAGRGTKTITTNLWNINGADTSRNIVGRSIIVHSGIDTYSVQPSGNSGNRIGCGPIK